MSKIDLCFLTHNRFGVVVKSLKTFVSTLYNPEISWYVLDNQSTDGTAEWLLAASRKYPNLHLTLSSKNLGVGGGREELFSQVQGDVVVSLDSDVEVLNDNWLLMILHHLQKYDIVGHSGYLLDDTFSSFIQKTGECDVVSGYCQAFERQKMSGFHFDKYFGRYWHEDSDMCLWGKARGLSCFSDPTLGLRHNYWGSGDDGTGPDKMKYLKTKWESVFTRGSDGLLHLR